MKKHKPKFTPGEWVYPQDSSGAPDLAIFAKDKPMGTPKNHSSEHGAVIAHVVMYDAITGFLSKEQYKANAHLISAAPQLYAVCEKLEEWDEDGAASGGFASLIVELKAALKKARGE